METSLENLYVDIGTKRVNANKEKSIVLAHMH